MPEEDLIHEQQAEKRSHRRLLWSFVWLALAILVGAPLLWSWSVTRKWERLKAEYAAVEKTLDSVTLEPEKVPDGENVFGSIEAMMRGSTGEAERAEFLGCLTSNLGFQLENAALVSRSSFDEAYQQIIFDEEPLRLPLAGSLMPETMLQWIDERSPWVPMLVQSLSLPRVVATSGLSIRALSKIIVARGAIGVLADDSRVVTESLRMSIRHTEAMANGDAFGYFGSDKWLDVLWLAMIANMLDMEQSQLLLFDLERLQPLKYCIKRTLTEASRSIEAERWSPVLHRDRPLLFYKRRTAGLLEESITTLGMLRTTGLTGCFPRTESYRQDLDVQLLRMVNREYLDCSPKSLVEGHFKALQNTIVFQTKINLAKLALALEIYRFHHGQYPESTAALGPASLPSMPVDLMDGKPLRYRRDGSRYRIWSIGRNRVDDGGKFFRVTLKSNGWTHPIHDGDWVWFYPKAAE